MHDFTPIPALLGGLLIGLSAAIVLLFEGKVAGISGILGGLLRPRPGDTTWRATFFAGLLVGGLILRLVHPTAFGPNVASIPLAAAAGLIVGFGTRLGNGCTSGHGVCGNARLSARSMVATVTFILTGVLTVLVLNRLSGGAA